MKVFLVLTGMLAFSTGSLWAQYGNNYSIPLIGSDAPAFEAQSTTGLITFPKDYGNKWKILFSHPRDFTPVCSSEILELAQKQEEFKGMNVQIIVLSTDTLYQHFTWKKNLDTLKYKNMAPRVILMENHGMIACGSSPRNVETIISMYVKTARTLIGIYALGKPRFLTPENVARIHTRPDEKYRQNKLST